MIFTLAVSGNSLVVYVVVHNKAMQTVTNIFITNLAVSDLLVNFTSLWLTPVYTYVGHWIWGGWLCYGLPLFQGTSIFISTLTLMAIAIDRYFVIVHHSSSNINVNDHMSMTVCIAIITLIWTVSLLLVMPYAIHMRMTYIPEPCNFWLCLEDWAMEDLRSMYGVIVMALQFIVPFVIIGFSYTQIWNFLNNRSSMVSQRESEYENNRKKRLLGMLITMVVVFGTCWFPFNLLNILRDLHLDSFIGPYFSFLFLFAHVISMTATCWNPIVYAWMNEAFRERFIEAAPILSRWFDSGRHRRPRILTDCDIALERYKSHDEADVYQKPVVSFNPFLRQGHHSSKYDKDGDGPQFNDQNPGQSGKFTNGLLSSSLGTIIVNSASLENYTSSNQSPTSSRQSVDEGHHDLGRRMKPHRPPRRTSHGRWARLLSFDSNFAFVESSTD
ncbi:hypothetical protein AB6A40_007067 [Gnathostoma spinigerum]|uniref:G-protein coupled receptors family 1 profile domain-containing protein n=1 Tax=Gnathostoma spinigerum TaxID=75299 RepID=A0ABD6EKF1_9BILA